MKSIFLSIERTEIDPESYPNKITKLNRPDSVVIVEDPNNPGVAADASLEARVAALQKRIEIIGEVGRHSFAPRLTVILRDSRRVTGEYHGRELMWDFAKDARELRRLVPGLPIKPAQYDRLVAAIATLAAATSVDELIGLTLPEA